MNIHYRIVKVDPAAHGVVIRYWTDKVSEMDLAGPRNSDGTPILNAEGYPVATQTDVFMSLYDTPTPSAEELNKRIMMQAPVDWLKLQEDIKDTSVDTSMTDLRNLVGDSKAFTTEDIVNLREEFAANVAATAAATTTEAQALTKAYEVTGAISDALKVLQAQDPAAVAEFANGLKAVLNI